MTLSVDLRQRSLQPRNMRERQQFFRLLLRTNFTLKVANRRSNKFANTEKVNPRPLGEQGPPQSIQLVWSWQQVCQGIKTNRLTINELTTKGQELLTTVNRPGLAWAIELFRLHCLVTEHKNFTINGSNKNTLFKCYYLVKKKITIRGCPFRLFTNSRIVLSLKVSAAILANEKTTITMLRLFWFPKL